MTEPRFETSTPVFTVDGEVKREMARDVVRLEVEESSDGMKKLNARFLAQAPRQGSAREELIYVDGSLVDFGRKLGVTLGAGSAARLVFEGYISGLEICFREGSAPEMAVLAEDKLMTLRMTRRMKTYNDVTDADVAREIASAHGLRAEVDADGPTYKVLQQWNQSDLAFLRERARAIQAEIWLDEDTLHFTTRNRRTSTPVTLVVGGDLYTLEARADLAHQRTEVRVSGFDAGQRDAIDESAGADAIDAEISGGRTGVAILERAFGTRISYRVREVPLEDGEARAWARAEFLRRARAFVTVAGTAIGTPDMIVGSDLTLERAGAPFEGGGYYVTAVRHTYDLMSGFRTHFTAERPTLQEGA
jgi:phage protein D